MPDIDYTIAEAVIKELVRINASHAEQLRQALCAEGHERSGLTTQLTATIASVRRVAGQGVVGTDRDGLAIDPQAPCSPERAREIKTEYVQGGLGPQGRRALASCEFRTSEIVDIGHAGEPSSPPHSPVPTTLRRPLETTEQEFMIKL